MRWSLAAIAIAGIMLGGCGDWFDGPWGDVTVTKLNAEANFPTLPASARTLKYKLYGGFQGRTEFLYFEDSQAVADQFAMKLVGAVPDTKPYEFDSNPPEGDVSWWPTGVVAGARGRGVSEESIYAEGRREVLIVDHEGYSQVWAIKADPP